MANSINFYLNDIGSNIFTSKQIVETEQNDSPVKDTSAWAYNPVIETSEDEEGSVQIDSNNSEADTANDSKNTEQDNKEDYFDNLIKGSGIIVGDTLKSGVGVIDEMANNLGDDVKTAATGYALTIVGSGQLFVTPFVGLFKGWKTNFNNTVKGFRQIFSGQISKGFGSIIKGSFGVVTESVKWAKDGAKKVVQGMGKIAKASFSAVKSVEKAVVNGVKNVGKAIGKGIKKIFKGW